MSLQSCSRAFWAFSSSTTPTRRTPSAAPKLLRRRAPLVGALSSLCLGSIYAIACRSAARFCFVAQNPNSPIWDPIPGEWSKFVNQPSTRGLHSTGMEGALTTVPSIVVYVTVPNKEAGMKLAESIIKEKLAACVNRVPGIESVYWWDGKVETDAEELLIIKTRESLLGALTQHVKSNHEYDVPEVIALPITGGNEKYLEWIKDSTRDD
ncbi:protein CutA 1, chloroplastic isoform X1 [Musa acuminata AAA Group]|uniref:protein CutA 1, chloroplastic isoform X1 n=1 Tax=Musa acuminata AAA Group TaxID=214697 RepID=UPI0031D08DDB